MIRPEQLAGTQVHGQLRVTEATLNEFLRAAPQAQGVAIEVFPQRRVALRYGALFTHATLAPEVTVGRRPQLVIQLDSQLVAWGLKAVARQPFLEVRGKIVVLHLASLPGLREHADLWQHLKRVQLDTANGVLLIHFAIEIGHP